jgi:predicted peptidase
MKAVKNLLCLSVAFVMSCGMLYLTACSEHTHKYKYIYDESGHWQKCTDCDEETESEPHTYSGDTCTVCGYEAEPIVVDMDTVKTTVASGQIYHVDRDRNGTYSMGDYIYVGVYPQTAVTDGDTIAALNGLASSLSSPSTSENYGGWSYDGDGACAEYYYDVTYNGVQYRTVYARTQTWYEFEPICWEILSYDESNGTAFVNSFIRLDGRAFQNNKTVEDGETYVTGTQTYANNWEASTVRKFLNGSFMDWAFTSAEKARIKTTRLDNANTTSNPESKYSKAQTSTDDKVFLLSYQDLINADYGFNTTPSTKSDTRKKSLSEYAIAVGVDKSEQISTADGNYSGTCMLRSGSAGDSYQECVIDKFGSLSTKDVTDKMHGLAPAMNIVLESQFDGTAGWHDTDVTGSRGAVIKYSVFTPAGYNPYDASTVYPAVCFMPDATGANKSLASIRGNDGATVWTSDEEQAKHKCFVVIISVQNTPSTRATDFYDVIQDAMIQFPGFDTDRLYVTGQSMGGITAMSMNSEWQDLFAASFYVACQDETRALANATEWLPTSKFVYLTSEGDQSAYSDTVGLRKFKSLLTEYGSSYACVDDLDPTDGAAVQTACKNMFDANPDQTHFFVTYRAGILGDETNKSQEHMGTWKYSYKIEAIHDWLFAQHK